MDVITRKEARGKGLKRYFTGGSCLRGHRAERYVSTAQCTECKFVYYKGVDGKKKKALVSKKYRNSYKGRIQRLLGNARRRAKKVGRECSLTSLDIEIPKKCPILGIDIELGDDGGMNLSSPSLDRIDNTKGYIKGNVRVISLKANKYKSNMTIENILNMARYVQGKL